VNARFSILPGLTLALVVAGCSSTVAPPAAPTVAVDSTSTAKGGERRQEVTIRAAVQKVDLKSRKVTLKGYDGTTETIQVTDEVRNLDQVKKGDEVVVTFYQSVAFEVLKPGDPKAGVAEVEGIGRAKVGEQPGGAAARVVTIVADIVKLDRQHNTAVLRGPEGNLTTVDVANPANFDKVKVGDRVEITLTEALAIDVQPAPGH